MPAWYPAELTPDPQGRGWRVRFPDLPGCAARGRDQAAAAAAAEAALLRWLEARQDAGEPLPEPSALDALPPPARGAARLLIAAPSLKLQRFNVSFDGLLLARVDRAADSLGMTRSQFLSLAAAARLQALEPEPAPAPAPRAPAPEPEPAAEAPPARPDGDRTAAIEAVIASIVARAHAALDREEAEARSEKGEGET